MRKNKTRVHELKAGPVFFKDVEKGEEILVSIRCDRGFAVRDKVKVKEYDLTREETNDLKNYTGREMLIEITRLFPGEKFGISSTYCVFYFKVTLLHRKKG